MRQLWRNKPEDLNDIIVPRPDDARQAFSFYNIRTIIVRKNELRSSEYDRLREILDQILPGSTPAYQSANLEAYTIEPAATLRPFLFLGSGWYDLEHSDQHKWRWMSGNADVWIVNPQHTAQTLTIEFTAQSYQEDRSLVATLDGTAVASYTIAPMLQTIRLQLLVPPGEHALHFSSSTTEEPPPVKRNLSFMFLGMDIVPN
jgi:hypothetical protein